MLIKTLISMKILKEEIFKIFISNFLTMFMFMMSENLIRIIVIYQKNNNTYSILVSVPCWLQILYLYIVYIYYIV
jgi:hypothetical protein